MASLPEGPGLLSGSSNYRGDSHVSGFLSVAHLLTPRTVRPQKSARATLLGLDFSGSLQVRLPPQPEPAGGSSLTQVGGQATPGIGQALNLLFPESGR